MKPRTKKLLLAFVVFLIIGMVAIGWLQKNQKSDSGKASKDKPEPEPKKSKSSSSVYTPTEPQPTNTPIYGDVPIRKADKETIKAVQTDLNRAAIFLLQQPIKVDGIWGKQTQNFAKAVIGRDIADMTYQQFINRNANVTGTVTSAQSVDNHIKNLAEEAKFDIQYNAQNQELYRKINELPEPALRQFATYWKSQNGTSFSDVLKGITWKWTFGVNYGNLLRGTLNKLKL